MEDKAKESFQTIWRKKHKKEDHPDRRNVDACAVPLMIVANKWDSIKDENNPLARDRLGLKALCQVLRFLAHQHGASLVFTSSKDKTLNKQFRSLLSFTLFHKLDKAMRTEKSPDKAIYVPRGADTFDELLAAGPVALDGINQCINQIVAAPSCSIVASTSTPSTRRLLDSVAVPVSHRSTEHPTHWLICAQA